MEEQLIICMSVVVLLISYVCFYICKWTFEFCRSRQRYRYPVDVIPPIELRPPRYGEVVRITDAQATSLHSNLRPDNMTSDNINNDTQLNRETSRDNNSNNDGNKTDNIGQRNIGDESGATLSLVENSDVNFSSKNVRDSKSIDDSSVPSGSRKDTVDDGKDTGDEFDDGSKYNTASRHSSGVREEEWRAPSHWVNF